MRLAEISEAVAAVCPIDGINTDGEIWFRPEATVPQKEAARALLDDLLPALSE